MTSLPKPETVTEQLSFGVVRIVTKTNQGNFIGTGYICQILFEENVISHVLITNKHVIDDAVIVEFDVHYVTGENRDLPSLETITISLSNQNTFAVFHPNCDLVGFLLSPPFNEAASRGYEPYYRFIPDKIFAEDEDALKFDLVEPVTMVGYPDGLWDRKNKLPLFRRGYTASHPAIDFDGKPEFSVDIAVFSGSSGSPIFLIERGLLQNKGDSSFSPMQRVYFLGTLWGGPRITERGEIRIEPVPTSANLHVETGIRMHIGWVIKAKETTWLLKEMRRQMLAAGLVLLTDPPKV